LTAIIIDYDAGNLRSVARACAEVGLAAKITADPHIVSGADRIIFPGVGAAPSAMKSRKREGLDVALSDAFRAGTPMLGICLGLQISLEHSEEGDTPTLALVAGRVRRFDFTDRHLEVPQMVWNEVKPVRAHPLLGGLETGDAFYFVHSFFPQPEDASIIYGKAHYEHDFCCAFVVRNYFGVQFHPAKSGRGGMQRDGKLAFWACAVGYPKALSLVWV